MRLLSAAEVLSVADLPYEDVPVPEWGEDVGVRVRRLTGKELDAWEEETIDLSGDKARINRTNIRARFVAKCAIDAEGKPLFTAEQIAALGDKCGAALDRVYAVCQRINGRTKEDEEELLKN